MMKHKDMQHWGYDLVIIICLIFLFIMGIKDYDVLVYPDYDGRGSSIMALIRLINRILGKRYVLLIIALLALLFGLSVVRKINKENKNK